MSSLLLNSKKPGVQFEDKWHELKPTVNKLLKQQAVTTQEWQNLFWWVVVGSVAWHRCMRDLNVVTVLQLDCILQ